MGWHYSVVPTFDSRKSDEKLAACNKQPFQRKRKEKRNVVKGDRQGSPKKMW